MACGYAFIVSSFIFREFRMGDLPKVCEDTIIYSAPPLLIIIAMSAFSIMLAWLQVPQQLTAFVLASVQRTAGHPVLHSRHVPGARIPHRRLSDLLSW